jgi:hypothetical protein
MTLSSLSVTQQTASQALTPTKKTVPGPSLSEALFVLVTDNKCRVDVLDRRREAAGGHG